MNTEREISSAEQLKYDEYLQVVSKGPENPETIGEALWFILMDRLYRGHCESMKTFFDQCTNMDSEAGFKIIENWEQTPRGQEVTNAPLVKSVGGSAHGLEPMDAKGSFAQSKTQATTNKETGKSIHQPIDEQIGAAQKPEQEEPNGSKPTPTVRPNEQRLPASSVAAPSPAVTVTAKATKPDVALGSKASGQRKKTSVPKDKPPTGNEPVQKCPPTRVQPDADVNTHENQMASAPKAGKTGKQSGADLDGKPDITIPDLAAGKTVPSRLQLSEIKKAMGVQSRAAAYSD